MRKLISVLGAIIIITATTISVTSCGFTEPRNVILELPANVVPKSKPKVINAYKDIANNYNNERPDNPIKVEVRESPENNIDQEIATGQPLPNLYVSYGDAVTKNEAILTLMGEGNKIVNMAEAINWNYDYVETIKYANEPQIEFIENFKNNGVLGNELTQGKSLNEITHTSENNLKDHFTPLKHSFSREGSNNNKMYVVPTAKSGMVGIMNIRLINELVNIVTNGEVNLKETFSEIRDVYFFKTAKVVNWIGNKDVPLKNLEERWQLPLSNNYRESDKTISELFTQWFTGVNSIVGLQNVMQDLSKLEIIVLAYNLLVEYGGNKEYFKATFSIAMDDMPGFIYTMNANLGYDDKMIYDWNNKNMYTLNLYKSKPYSNSLKDTIELFDWADKIRPLNKDSGNNPDHGYGGITAKVDGNKDIKYTDLWQKQGMLAYFGSTSGIPYFIGKPEEEKVQPNDVIFITAPAYEKSPSNNFVTQQGPGMGMFKSKNQIKNEIAIDFLNYFLKAENNTKFAIDSAYIPSNYYSYYNKENQSGIPTNENSGSYYQTLESKISKQYVDNILKNDIKFWTQTATPFGDAMRNQILIPWFNSNFKTVGKPHNLTFEAFWNELDDKKSIISAWKIVHNIFIIEGNYLIN